MGEGRRLCGCLVIPSWFCEKVSVIVLKALFLKYFLMLTFLSRVLHDVSFPE